MDLGELDLEESLKLFERGMSLVSNGRKQLEEAELKIKNLTKNSKSD